MNSLTDAGSTARWRRLRAHFSALMPLPCWRCGHLIRPEQSWDLGHRVDRVNGGTDADAWPEHRHANAGCIGNRAAGAVTRRPTAARVSREW
jgi:hypothetical protein